VAVSRYCLDTSAYSRFRRSDTGIVELVERAEWIGIPCVALGELHAGFRRGSRRVRNEAELEAFLAEPIIEELPVDSEVARIFGEITAELRRRGTPMPTNDIWIAATCTRAGATLLTYDAHFQRFPRVEARVLRPVV
jgi:predicted nucleic acid-binding protein